MLRKTVKVEGKECDLPSGSACDEDELALDFVVNLSHGVTE